MRHWRTAVATATVLTLALTGCAREIEGVAKPDPRKPGVAITSDEFGIITGFADAPVQLELFTEPQCEHCADLQHEFGEQLKDHIEAGRLAVTYRPMTFLDESFFTDYSAVASNAMFLAVDPSTTAGTFQTFVEDLWANQDLSFEEFTDADFADIAMDSGLSPDVVERIAAGEPAVDTDGMADFNSEELLKVAPGGIRTPIVYDLKQEEVVDTSDTDWVDNLVESS